MGSNFAQTERKTVEIEEKLNLLLESVEQQHPFSKQNFVFINKLVFLWIIGKDDRMDELLKTEMQSIIGDTRAMWVIHSNIEEITEQGIYTKFYEAIDCASKNYLNVDIDHMMVCPIFLSDCFEGEGSEERFTQAALYVQREMRRRHRYLEWSPFILLDDEKIEQTQKQMAASIYVMEALIEEGKKNFQACCCPACVISDVNEHSQAISEEQKAKVIIMLIVFRNTQCQNGQNLNAVMSPISENEKEYFFTARAISICEPVRSLVLNRLLAVHNYFKHGIFPQERLFDNFKQTFFEGKIWKEHLDKVAHDEKYAVLTDSIYSNIPRGDEKEYEKSLDHFCRKYYIEPLVENKEELLQEWWKEFFEEFFMRQVGSVESLEHIEENREKILEKIPQLNVRDSQFSYVNDMRKIYEERLRWELKRYPRKLAEEAMNRNPEGKYMQKFCENKEFLKDIMQKLDRDIHSQIQRLRQSELLLNTGGGHIADPQEEAERWLQDYSNNQPQRIKEIYREYQKTLCLFFQQNMIQEEKLGEYLLDNYNKIVSGSIESREKYMKTKLANLAGSNMEQIVSKLGESWRYPLRLIGSTDQGRRQKLYMLGNPDNFVCSKILNQPNYQVAFKECALDDRLEIVRISDRLTIQQIISKEQESEESGVSL